MKNKAYENFLDIILKVPTVEKCDLINKLDKEITVDIELQDGFSFITTIHLLKNGYHFFKFFSISSLLKEFRGNYYKAIKNVEDYDSDLTYFIDFYLDMTVKSIRKVSKDFKNQYLLKVIKAKILDRGLELNKRQEKTLEKVIKIGKRNMDISFYMSQNKVVQETARKDLSELVEMDILLVSKQSKKNVYNLNERF